MKKLLIILALLVSQTAFGATLTPIQLLNPSGSTSGQSIVSTGSNTAPAWSTIGLTNGVSGLLPVANGGSGVGTLTGLALGNGTSAFSAYAGTSCTNQFPRSLNASGVATCASVANTDLSNSAVTIGSTSVSLGGTASSISGLSLVAPALGTPASGVATNLTGTASGLTAGNVTTNANLTGPITSAGNTTAVAAQTGTGSTFVMQASPTLMTPVLGVATATSINKVGFTAPTTAATFAFGTDNATITMQGTDTYVGRATTDTLTNKTLTNPVISTIVNTGSLTLPTSTDTLIGKNTTDTLTNKTFDTAGTGNSLKINGTTVSAVTGTGSAVLATSPALVTPTLGVATATSVNKMAITAPVTSSTLAVADGKTATINSTLTLAGTDGTTMTFPATSATIARTDAANSFIGVQTISSGVIDGSIIGGTNPAAITGTSISATSALLGPPGTVTVPAISFTGHTTTGMLYYNNGVSFTGSSTEGAHIGLSVDIGTSGALRFFSGNISGSGVDLVLVRDAANVLAQRNAANGQSSRLYNTWTDSSNGEWLETSWASNAVTLSAKANGTGTVRTLNITAPVFTTYKHTSQEIDASYTYNTPTTGQTVTLATGTQTAIIDPAGTLAALTVTLPGCTSGYDGSIARFSSSQVITTLTVNATSGTVVGGPTTLGLGSGSGYICRGSTTTWYRLY